MAFDTATLAWASNRNRYFLLLVNTFLKWIELHPMEDIGAFTIVNGIFNECVPRQGPPNYMLIDQAPTWRVLK